MFAVRPQARRPSRLWLTPYLYVALLTLCAAVPMAAQGTEIIRGTVLDDQKRPVPQVNITIVGLASQATQNATTNAKGVFNVLYTNPEGDYVLTFRKIGFRPVSVRLTRTGISSILSVDLTMQSSPYQLDTLVVRGNTAPLMGVDRGSIGGLEQSLLAGSLFTLDPSDLLALALNTPGVFAEGDSGFSVLGAASNQNSTTVDGARFGGGNLPQDAIGSAKLVTTSADPARGSFAGGSTTTTLRGGGDIFAANFRGRFSDHHLAWNDPTWPNPVPRVGGLSGSVSGPIVKRKSHYFLSWDANDNRTEQYSLLSPRESILSQYGMLADTASAISNTLRDLGIPLTTSRIPLDRMSRRISSSLTLDFQPASTTSVRLTYSGNMSENSGGGGILAYPSLSSRSTNTFHFVSAKLSGYLHGFLDEVTASLNYSNFKSDPFLQLPSASVRVGTVYDDGRTGLTNVRFGGGSGVSRGRNTNLDVQNELSLLTKDSKHRYKAGLSASLQWNRNFSTGNQYGSYTYQSLDDLAANRPASFSRTLSSFERSSRGASSAFWLGDEWRLSQAFQLQWGLRLDASHPSTKPDYNPVVDSIFGLRTDRVPGDVGFVPRLGFSWVSSKRRGKASSGNSTAVSLPPGVTFDQIPPEMLQYFMGGNRPNTQPGFTVSGSLGGYRGVTSPERIAGLVDATGLPQTRRTLGCVGDVTPIPVWGNDAVAPEQCLDGTGSTSFSVNQPTVTVFDPSFRAPLSWRASLGIDGLKLHKWNLGISGTYSYGVNGESSLDANLRRTGGFTLASEGDRPVFVTPGDIVPETGQIAPGASRVSRDFGRVSQTISDLHNRTAQLSLTITPPKPLFNNKLNYSFQYIYNNSRAESRGFGGAGGGGFEVSGGSFVSFGGGGGGTTGSDPAQKEWSRGRQPTHQLVISANARIWWFNLNVRTNITSGYPYTPTVVGDINGDGISNDRAFISDPALTADPTLAAQMRELLDGATGGARDCLQKQFGHVAGNNSCTTPWQARMDLNLNFQPPQSFGFGDRLRVTTTMVNASGALVRLFGLQNTPLGRSATTTQVDGRLLYVTGFDPVAQRYNYRVNQLFGEPLDYGTSRRRFPPFQLQLGVEYKLGGPPTSPMARGLGLIPSGKEPPLTAEQVRAKLEKTSRNPVEPILALKDSLKLAPEQVASLATLSTTFRRSADSLLQPVVDYVVKKGKRVADQELSPRIAKAQPQIARLIAATSKSALALLTPEQQKKAPQTAAPGLMPGGRAMTPMGAPAPGAGTKVEMMPPAGAIEVKVIRP